jgi:hypothetical protein
MSSKGVYEDCVANAKASYDNLKGVKYVSILGSSLDANQMRKAKPDQKHWLAGTAGTSGERKMTQATPDQLEREMALASGFEEICKKLWNYCDTDPVVSRDPRWLNLKQDWPRAMFFVEPSEQVTWSGTYVFNGEFSIIAFAITPGSDYSSDAWGVGGWNSLLLHELAHTTHTVHGSEFRSAWMFLCRIATEQLGISVRLTCGECNMYGVCDKAMCPKCNWVNVPASGCCTSKASEIWGLKEI